MEPVMGTGLRGVGQGPGLGFRSKVSSHRHPSAWLITKAGLTGQKWTPQCES